MRKHVLGWRMSVVTETWSAWAARIASDWNDTLQQAWDDAVSAVRAQVEAAGPAVIGERVSAFVATVWGGGGLVELSQALTTRETSARAAGVPVEALQAAVAADLQARGMQVTDIDLTAAAATGRVHWYGMGYMRDTKVPTPGTTGFVPLIIGGLVVGLGAVCWALVRIEQAQADQAAWGHMNAVLAAAEQAAREGRPFDLQAWMNGASAVAQGSYAAGGDGGSGYGGSVMPYLLGGAALLAVVALIGSRR